VDEPLLEEPSGALSALGAALAAEARGDWPQSFVLCRKALAEPEQQPDAFNLLGRLCWTAGDAANAIALQQFVLTLDPHHARAAGDLRVARGAIRSSAQAEAAFRAAAALHPDITCHHRDPGSLLPFVGMDAVEQHLRSALELDPSFAPAHAALGNVLARRQRNGEALDAYRLAAMLAWAWPDVHLALAAFYEMVRDAQSAARHRHEALSRKQLYAASDDGAPRKVLVLAAPGGPVANAPLDFCVNHARVALHVYYITGGAVPDLPPHDLVFCAIEEAEAHDAVVERCTALIGALGKPAVNRPERLGGLRRSALPRTLGGVAGCAVPQTQRVDRNVLRARLSGAGEPVVFPVLVRPVDTHRGDWQERIATAAELDGYLARVPGGAFNVSRFIDYKSSDGYSRKYRVIVVDGEPFPYHLAISGDWKVHYHSSLMEHHAWMRDEEKRFFEDPQSVFPAWDAVFRAIARAVGLDYFGIDCALGPDGSVLVFECGSGMLVHCQDDPAPFAYKYEHVPRIFAALDALLERKAAGVPGP